MNTQRHVIGVDPGKDGGFAVLSGDMEIAVLLKTPLIKGRKSRSEYDVQAIVEMVNMALREFRCVLAVVEKCQPLPSSMGGVSANFGRGLSFGLWTGILTALKIPVICPSPRTWQAEMFRDVNSDDTKQASVLVASRMWPGRSWLSSDRGKKPDHGLTDAVLLAEYGRRKALVQGTGD